MSVLVIVLVSVATVLVAGATITTGVLSDMWRAECAIGQCTVVNGSVLPAILECTTRDGAVFYSVRSATMYGYTTGQVFQAVSCSLRQVCYDGHNEQIYQNGIYNVDWCSKCCGIQADESNYEYPDYNLWSPISSSSSLTTAYIKYYIPRGAQALLATMIIGLGGGVMLLFAWIVTCVCSR